MLFTATQQQTLQAVLDRLIPPDDYPGAWEAGVGDYLYRQLDGGDLRLLLPAYRDGLNALDVEAEAQYDSRFAALDAAQQDALLHALETGRTETPWPLSPQDFLRMLAHHAAEGYYSDPGNGGNRDEVAWKMIGFEIREGSAAGERETAA
jgi:gluconate 2-dehydrogenase gamma chain